MPTHNLHNVELQARRRQERIKLTSELQRKLEKGDNISLPFDILKTLLAHLKQGGFCQEGDQPFFDRLRELTEAQTTELILEPPR